MDRTAQCTTKTWRMLLPLLALWALPCRADTEGLRGLTMPTDDPACAFACTGSLAFFELACSGGDHGGGGHAGHGAVAPTSPECRASDEPYLTTVAWCFKTKCAPYAIPTSRLEAVWELKVTGSPAVAAKWSYTEALLHVDTPPTRQLAMGDILNSTSLVPQLSWQTNLNTAEVMGNESRTQSIYGLVLLLVGVGVPILTTILGHLPFGSTIGDRFVRPWVVYAPIIGNFHVRPLPYLAGNAPTVGQALFVGLMVVLNVVTTATGYRTVSSHNWLRTPWQQTVAFLMYRTGVLSYAMAPLTVLFAGRNNVLLWVSDWSHASFLLLHRWMARLFVLQALLHSVLAVVVYKDMLIFDVQAAQAYWFWGIVATVLGCVMLVASTLYLRQRGYEVFVLVHVLLAVLVLVGSWYHVALRFPPTGGGFNTWIYVAVAVWVFDRVARVARIVKNGRKHARVSDLGNGYLRVDIDGVRCGPALGRHIYVHFPTLQPLRPWESHPFSLLPSTLLRPAASRPSLSLSLSPSSSPRASAAQQQDTEKAANVTAAAVQNVATPAAGVTLFVRKAGGMTKALSASDRLVTLVDGPYPNNSVSAALRCDRVLLLAGGIGITGVLPWIDSHANVKLCWSVKEDARCLVEAIEPAIARLAKENVDVRIGPRLEVVDLLELEIQAGWAKVAVVVCGPGAMCDDVRQLVVAAAKRCKKTTFVLDVEAYSW